MERSDIKSCAKLNAVRDLLDHPETKHKTFILVEGESDVRLFRKLFHKEHTVIRSLDGGVRYLETHLEKLAKDYPNLIGIRDADFLHLEGKSSTLPILFLTDVHDMEMMLICCNETLKSIVCEYGEMKDTHTLRTQLLESVKFLAYLRWYNQIHDLELNFKHLDIRDFIDTSLKVDELKCIQLILQRSSNTQNINEIELLNKVKALVANHDLTQLCCGHDVSKSMAQSFSKGKKGISQESVEKDLRIAYHLPYFQKTKLYGSLKQWSLNNKRLLFEE